MPSARAPPTVIDVREASEWEQGHMPGAVHICKSYVEQQIEARRPRSRTPRSSSTAPAASGRCSPPRRSSRDGLHQRGVDVGRVPGLEGRGAASSRRRSSSAPSRSSATAGTCSSPRSARPARRSCSSQGPAHRCRRARQPGGALPGGGRRRDDRPRRLRRRRPAPTSSARSSTRRDRIGERKVESARIDDQRAEPRRQGRPRTRRCSSPRTSSGSSPATTSSSTARTRSRRATSSTTRRSRPASRSSTPRCSGSRAS